MGGSFHMVLTEREISMILDALEQCMVARADGSPWSWTDYATLAGTIQERISW
jgi:hypothetical protein